MPTTSACSRQARPGGHGRADVAAARQRDPRERRADENRRVRYAVAVGFVSAVAIPASLILAFLGINACQRIDRHDRGELFQQVTPDPI
jgi:hypothetical protein